MNTTIMNTSTKQTRTRDADYLFFTDANREATAIIFRVEGKELKAIKNSKIYAFFPTAKEAHQNFYIHPVLMGLLSNVDSVIYVDVKKAMYEIYPFYKKYRHRALDDSVWKDIVESAEALEKKWNGNLWVRRVMLNLVNELDKESQEMQREAAGGNVENHASKAA
jgi:hypothetical protein